LYGIEHTDFEKLLASQDGKCAVCNSDDPKSVYWHIDHNHSSGDVRGILCGPCNAGLGHFSDDVDRLAKAIAYLKRHAASVE
jgi:hypothetical protein